MAESGRGGQEADRPQRNQGRNALSAGRIREGHPPVHSGQRHHDQTGVEVLVYQCGVLTPHVGVCSGVYGEGLARDPSHSCALSARPNSSVQLALSQHVDLLM